MEAAACPTIREVSGFVFTPKTLEMLECRHFIKQQLLPIIIIIIMLYKSIIIIAILITQSHNAFRMLV